MRLIDSPQTGPLANTLSQLRSELRMDGRRVSQFTLALSLGISQKQVARLERVTESELPPAVRLACEFIAAHGLAGADDLADPGPDDIRRLVDSILLTREQVATLLGKRRQVLYSLETGSHQVTIKRLYLLAMMRLRDLYGLTDDQRKALNLQLASGACYRDRASSPLRLVRTRSYHAAA